MKQHKLMRDWVEEMSPIKEVPKETKVVLHQILEQRRLTEPYKGDDIRDFVNSTKTYNTTSQAFKDANYANWIEGDDEWTDMHRFISEFICWGIPLIAIALCIALLIIRSFK